MLFLLKNNSCSSSGCFDRIHDISLLFILVFTMFSVGYDNNVIQK